LVESNSGRCGEWNSDTRGVGLESIKLGTWESGRRAILLQLGKQREDWACGEFL
jgi:hypothetical protein